MRRMTRSIQYMRVPAAVTFPNDDGKLIERGFTAKAPCKAFIIDGRFRVYEQAGDDKPVTEIFNSALVDEYTGKFDSVPFKAVTEAGPVTVGAGPGCACSFAIKRFIPPGTPKPEPVKPTDPSLVIRYRIVNQTRQCLDPLPINEGNGCRTYDTRDEAQFAIGELHLVDALIEGFYGV